MNRRAVFNRITILLILLSGAGLRWHVLAQDVRFQPDEALFATFARNAAVYGDWMLPGALDKPPLSLYAAALSMQFVGVTVNQHQVLDLDLRQGEFAARLPGTLAGILLIALVYVLGGCLSSPSGGLFAAALAAGSPWLTAFSATAFTDPLMLTCLVAALVMAVRGRPAWSGVWLALAFWSKQQALFYLPLILWVIIVPVIQRNAKMRPVGTRRVVSKISVSSVPLWFKSLPRFTTTFASGALLLLLWDAARGTTSIFALAAVNNNPERTFITVAELLPRLLTWLRYASTGFGGTGLTVLILLLAILPLRRHSLRLLLLIYCLLYFAAHLIIAFNTYDRYLLPLIPLIAVLAGAQIAGLIEAIPITRRNPVFWQGITPLILIITLYLTGMSNNAFTHYPTDTRPRDHQIITLAAYLNAKPLGAILYNHWLGWELTYYLGAWSDKRQVYYPEPVIQAQDAPLNPDPAPRYLIVPRDVDITPWLDAFRAAKFDIALEYVSSRYIVYRLLPPFASP